MAGLIIANTLLQAGKTRLLPSGLESDSSMLTAHPHQMTAKHVAFVK